MLTNKIASHLARRTLQNARVFSRAAATPAFARLTALQPFTLVQARGMSATTAFSVKGSQRDFSTQQQQEDPKDQAIPEEVLNYFSKIEEAFH